jgi:hypothetical protein
MFHLLLKPVEKHLLQSVLYSLLHFFVKLKGKAIPVTGSGDP